MTATIFHRLPPYYQGQENTCELILILCNVSKYRKFNMGAEQLGILKTDLLALAVCDKKNMFVNKICKTDRFLVLYLYALAGFLFSIDAIFSKTA